jgi:hypothetical protein
VEQQAPERYLEVEGRGKSKHGIQSRSGTKQRRGSRFRGEHPAPIIAEVDEGQYAFGVHGEGDRGEQCSEESGSYQSAIHGAWEGV